MNNELLEQIKDEVAKDHEYIDFKHIFEPDHDHYSAIINEIAERYAAACVEEAVTVEENLFNNLMEKYQHMCKRVSDLIEEKSQLFTKEQLKNIIEQKDTNVTLSGENWKELLNWIKDWPNVSPNEIIFHFRNKFELIKKDEIASLRVALDQSKNDAENHELKISRQEDHIKVLKSENEGLKKDLEDEFKTWEPVREFIENDSEAGDNERWIPHAVLMRLKTLKKKLEKES